MGILATHWFDSVVGTSFSFPVSVLEQDEIYSTTEFLYIRAIFQDQLVLL